LGKFFFLFHLFSDLTIMPLETPPSVQPANVTINRLQPAVDTAPAPAPDLPATVQDNNPPSPNLSATQAGTPGPSFPDWALHPELGPPEGDQMAEILTGPDGQVRESLQLVIWLVLISFLANIALSSRALSVTPETSMDEDEREEILTGGLVCVLCREYIFVSPADLGRRAVLWCLAHCGHPLHLRCLSHASQPPTQAPPIGRRRGGKYFLEYL